MFKNWGAPRKSFGESQNSKFCLKFGVCAPITLGLWGAISPIFYRWRAAMQAWSSGYSFFGGTAPLRIWEGKNRPKIGAILRNFAIRLRISPKRMKISTSGKAADQLRSLPRSTKKLGEVWSPNKKVIGVHVDPPKVTLFEWLYFGP